MARTSDNRGTTGVITLAAAAAVLWWLFVGTTWQFTPVVVAAVCGLIAVSAITRKQKK